MWSQNIRFRPKSVKPNLTKERLKLCSFEPENKSFQHMKQLCSLRQATEDCQCAKDLWKKYPEDNLIITAK